MEDWTISAADKNNKLKKKTLNGNFKFVKNPTFLSSVSWFVGSVKFGGHLSLSFRFG
jgi:hypothetical protein